MSKKNKIPSTHNFTAYQHLAMRTAGEGDFLEITKLLKSLDDNAPEGSPMADLFKKLLEAAARDEHRCGLMYDGLALAGEAGEVADYIKKVMWHGKPLDPEHVELELGDILWHINRMTTRLGKNLVNVAQKNIDKLVARYPQGFSHKASENRKS